MICPKLVTDMAEIWVQAYLFLYFLHSVNYFDLKNDPE